jgi:hypothetical protein
MTVMRLRVSVLALLTFAALSAGVAAELTAQGVRVRVLDHANAPIPGALISLKRDGQVALERLTNGDGLRVLTAPPASGYTLEVRRVGFAPFVSPAFSVTPTDTQPLELRVPETRAVLSPPPARASASGAQCQAGEAGRTRAGELWEQMRIALVSAEIVRTERLERLAIRRFERTFGRDGTPLGEGRVNSSGLGMQLFRAASPTELSRRGFAVLDSIGETVFRAPDIAVLLSPEFASDHCFAVVTGQGPTVGMMGLRFEPVAGRRLADVEGVLWADGETAQLRFAEFTYRMPPPIVANGTGGRILFEQLGTSSHWIAREWLVRTPVVTQAGQVLGFREEGGEAMEVSPRMLFVMDSIADSRKVPGVVTGVVLDSLTGTPFEGATVWLDNETRSVKTDSKGLYFIRGVVPGAHVVRFSHPQLDSIGIRPPGVVVKVASESMSDANLAGPSLHTLVGGACSDTLAVMTGIVRDVVTNAPVDSADVTMSWIEVVLDANRRPTLIAPRETVARTDASGRYGACVSALNEITAFAQRGVARSGSIDLLTGARRLGIAHLALDLSTSDSLRGDATLRGTVRYQDGSPLVNAVVTLTDPEYSTNTNDSGQFRLSNIPGGTRVIDTRALGHAPMRNVVEVRPGDTSTVNVFMRKVTLLDPILVRAAADDRSARTLADLEGRRRRRMGFRVTPAQMTAFKDLRLDAVIRSVPFAQLRTNPAPRLTLTESGGEACRPSVWLDGRRSDISVVVMLRAKDVLTVEVMRMRGDVPVEYQEFSDCGAVLVWMKPASLGK